jgi:aspartate/methionine/tyrosine aminotransferase
MAAIAALQGPQDSVTAMMEEFTKRRDLIVRGLNSLPGITCPTPQGAFYAFPNIRASGMTSKEFADRALNEAGVALLAGTSFGAFGDGYIRISFANSQENLREAVDRLRSIL